MIFLPSRWLRRAAIKAEGLPAELQAEAEAMADSNTVTVNSDDDGIHSLRQSNGDRFNVRWNVLECARIRCPESRYS